MGRGADNVLLDFKDVSKMDSSGIGELIASHNPVAEKGGALKLMNMPPKLLNVFGATQIVTVLDGINEISSLWLAAIPRSGRRRNAPPEHRRW